MQIIFGKEIAEQLRERYTVLELETFDVEGQLLEAFCVVPAEAIALSDVTNLEHNIKLHQEFAQALKDKNYKLCQDLYSHVIGKFSGELDSYYDEIIKRINNETQLDNTRIWDPPTKSTKYCS